MKTRLLLTLVLCSSITALAQSDSRSSRRDEVRSVVIPVGTELQVRVNESLTSETAQPGDQFTASLVNSIEDENGRIIFGRGAYINGRVISAKPSGRLSDSGELVLSINSIRSGSQTANITVGPYEVKGQSHTGSNTGKIGGGAALGAIIGGIAGGGKGAAIGAGAGAGAGTATAAATGKKNAKVNSEDILRFVTSTDANVVAIGSTPSSTSSSAQSINQSQNDNRQNDNQGDVELRRRDNSISSTSAAPNTQMAANTQPTPPTYSNAAGTSTIPASSDVTATSTTSFSARDRRVINSCIAENAASLPAAATQRSSQSYGSQASLEKNGIVPVVLQRKVISLPLACERQLPALSNDLERVIYNRQVMLINSSNRILDLFVLTQ